MKELGRTAGIHKRRLEVLRSLYQYQMHCGRAPTPMEIGGRNGSHHSPDLLAMAKMGFVKVQPRYAGITGAMGHSGSNRYAITVTGIHYLNFR